ncbi:MAG: FkbM family methyltransferase [Acidobacteriia bacterium]|nr:FkbM family methyltransferase [Terriglobia bacterium]
MFHILSRIYGLIDYCFMFSDWQSIQNWRKLKNGRDRGMSITPLRLRHFKEPVYCRPRTTDANVFYDTFWGKYHRAPASLSPVLTILDLGSNVGYTMLDYAWSYPSAKILGVELDAGNFEICQRNVEPYKPRCEVLHAAAWYEDGDVTYKGESEWGFHIAPGGEQKVRAISISSLIGMLDGFVDYLKMDIEGAEREVLNRCADWIRSVRCLKVEIHKPWTVEECIPLLESFNLSCQRDSIHHEAVIALNQAYAGVFVPLPLSFRGTGTAR